MAGVLPASMCSVCLSASKAAMHPSGRRMAVGLVKRQGGAVPMVWEWGTPWPWPESRHGELDPDTKRARLNVWVELDRAGQRTLPIKNSEAEVQLA